METENDQAVPNIYYFAEQESEGYNKNIPNGMATFMSQAIGISITDQFVNHFLHFFKY